MYNDFKIYYRKKNYDLYYEYRCFSINENVIADIFVLGGRYNPITSSLTGPFTEDLLKNLYF